MRVATGRGRVAEAERFPAANEVVAVCPPDLGDVIDSAAHTYAVPISYNFADDRLVLKALLETETPHIGIIGP